MKVQTLAVCLIVYAATAWGQQNATETLPNDLATMTEASQRALVSPSDFIYTFPTIDQQSLGGQISGMFINNNPGLATLPGDSIGQLKVTLQPCAINQPHVHPRGSEFTYVISGQIFFGFVEENPGAGGFPGGRFIAGNVSAGETFIAPQGLVHYEQNLECSPATFIASFPTKDPGTSVILNQALLQLPVAAIRASLGIDDVTITTIQGVVRGQKNPSQDPVCLARCSLPPVTAPEQAAGFIQAPHSYLSGV